MNTKRLFQRFLIGMRDHSGDAERINVLFF